MKRSVKTIKVESWDQFKDLATSDDYRSWAFRGQSNADWPLEPTLARYLKRYKIHRSVWSNQELRIYGIFKRKAHEFLKHLPADDDAFEWLATMQHHGAPTRLLDFTWSPYVAAFFAFERAITTAAIWAVFPPLLRYMQHFPDNLNVEENVHDHVGPWKPGNYEKFFVQNEFEFVTQGEPYRMNRRQVAQSGTFVIPSRIDKSVEEILMDNGPIDHSLVKFVMNTEKMRHESIRQLYNMNITNATLFPDLDGLARSMAMEFELHWAYDPITGEKFNDFYNKLD